MQLIRTASMYIYCQLSGMKVLTSKSMENIKFKLKITSELQEIIETLTKLSFTGG